MAGTGTKEIWKYTPDLAINIVISKLDSIRNDNIGFSDKWLMLEKDKMVFNINCQIEF